SKFVVSAFEDQTAKILEVETGQLRHTLMLKGNVDCVHTMAFSPDGKRLATASNTLDQAKDESGAGEIKIWDAQTGEELLALPGQYKWVSPLVFSPNGQQLAAGLWGTISVWDSRTGENLLTLKVGTQSVHDLEFSADGTRLIGASYENEQED